MAKNIVFCADGTWNSPDEDQDDDHTPDPTNVYKLFLCLDGALTVDSLRLGDEQEKVLEQGGATVQVAKYIHGVGDSRNPIKKVLGGAFGAGVIARVVRGYTFISRNYVAGDRIYITGFSRGAYTARALGGLIASQGLLAPALTVDKEKAYRHGAEAWYRYRKQSDMKPSWLARLAEVASNLPAFLSSGSLAAKDLVPIDHIAAVAVWDTVGALGLPEFNDDGRVDAFRFIDTRLSKKVGQGIHAVALDERRVDFTPTLWDAAPNVLQVAFPGAHADVGGGYPIKDGQSGLSDGALAWMIAQLGAVGVNFAAAPGYVARPDAGGVAHQPWAHVPWNVPKVKLGPRTLPPGCAIHPSVTARKALAAVVAEPGTPAAPYRPENLPA
ncbi:MAG: DUF2235 domain-containing protein [Rhodocyclaceae bacterium]|nr:DUF2235 domain-containing protein [Rhodocyclaceae bacterium]MBX3669884.1 DUF2235 domain-containing protein [Rhodocyclaceae bacterium]